MAKVVCEDCGEVLAEGVDEEEAQDIADSHSHNDAPTFRDRRDGRDTDAGNSEFGDGDGGFDEQHDLGGDAEDDTTPEDFDGGDTDYDDHDTPELGDLPEIEDKRTFEDDDLEDGELGNLDHDTDAADEADGPGEDIDIDSELDAMDAMDDERDPGEWYNIDSDTDYTEVDEEFEERFEEIRDDIEADDSEVERMLRKRDSEGGSHVPYEMNESGDYVPVWDTKEYRELRDDVVEAFEQFKVGKRPSPSRQGNTIDIDRVVQRAAGDKSQNRLFRRDQRSAHGDRLIAVTADFSGSVYAARIKKAIAAIGEAVETIGDEFVATAWTDARRPWGVDRGGVTTGIITGPTEEFDTDQLSAFESGGGTPLADGIDVATTVGDECHARQKVILVVTDGKANTWFKGPDGDAYLTGDSKGDARRVVEDARINGYKVIGIGYSGADENYMSSVFGRDGYVMAEQDTLADDLVDVYRRQLRV